MTEKVFLAWEDGGHDPLDFENIPPRPPTPRQVAARVQVSTLTGIFDYYGIPYTEEPGWRERQEGYNWYEGGPFGVMVHHTVSVPYPAGSAYPKPEGNRSDGRVICNILIQPDGTVNLIAAGPANYSSGVGDEDTLDIITRDERFYGPQSGSYAEWYGNRAYINIETVASGDGGPIPQVQENSVIATCAALCYLYGWSAWRCIGHLDHRGTKIDPKWTAEYGTAPYTISGLQDKINEILIGGLPPNGGDEDMWNDWVIGMVTGWAEDKAKTEAEFTRLNTIERRDGGYALEPGNTPATVAYFVGLLDDPTNPEWRGFVARTWLSVWSF